MRKNNRSHAFFFFFGVCAPLEGQYVLVLADKEQIPVSQDFINQSKVLQALMRREGASNVVSLETMKEIDSRSISALIDIVEREKKSYKGKIPLAESLPLAIKRKPLQELVRITNVANSLEMKIISLHLVDALKERYTSSHYLTNFFLNRGLASLERVHPSFEKLHDKVLASLKNEILNEISSLCFLRRIKRLNMGSVSPSNKLYDCFSPQGSYYAYALTGGNISIWDTHRQVNFVLRTNRQEKRIRTMVFNLEETLLATSEGGENSTIRIWDVQNRNLINEFQEVGGIVTTVAFNYDNSEIAFGMSDGTIQIFEVRTKHKKAELTPLVEYYKDLDSSDGFSFFDASGNYMVIVRKELLQIWDILKNQSRGKLFFVKPYFYSLLFSCRASLILAFNSLKELYDFNEIKNSLKFGKKGLEEWERDCSSLFNSTNLKAY